MQCAILVAGLPGSGKSVLARAAERLGMPVVSMGDAVRQEARRRGLSLNSKTMSALAELLRKERGPEAVAELTLQMVPNASVVVIEGVRSPREVEFFRKRFNMILVIAVHSSPRTRYARLKSRGRSDDPKSWEEFVERDRRELMLGIGEVIALADAVVVNEDVSLEEFLGRCVETLQSAVREAATSLRGRRP